MNYHRSTSFCWAYCIGYFDISMSYDKLYFIKYKVKNVTLNEIQ